MAEGEAQAKSGGNFEAMAQYALQDVPAKEQVMKLVAPIANKTESIISGSVTKGAELAGMGAMKLTEARLLIRQGLYTSFERRAFLSVREQIKNFSPEYFEDVEVPEFLLGTRPLVLPLESFFKGDLGNLNDNTAQENYKSYHDTIHAKPDLKSKYEAVSTLANNFVQHVLELSGAAPEARKNTSRYHILLSRVVEIFIKIFGVSENTISEEDVERSLKENNTARFIRDNLDNKRVLDHRGGIMKFDLSELFGLDVFKFHRGDNIAGSGGLNRMRNAMTAAKNPVLRVDVRNLPTNRGVNLDITKSRDILGLTADAKATKPGVDLKKLGQAGQPKAPEKFYTDFVWPALEAKFRDEAKYATGPLFDHLDDSQNWAIFRALKEVIYLQWLKEVDETGILTEAVYGAKDKAKDSSTLGFVSAADGETLVGGIGSKIGKVASDEKQYLIEEMEVLVSEAALAPHLAKSFTDMLKGIGVDVDYRGKYDPKSAKAPSDISKLAEFLGLKGNTSISPEMAGKAADKLEDIGKIAKAIEALSPSPQKEELVKLLKALQKSFVPVIVDVAAGSLQISGNTKAVREALEKLIGNTPSSVRVSSIPAIASEGLPYSATNVEGIINSARVLNLGVQDDKVVKLLSLALNIPAPLLKSHPIEPKDIPGWRESIQETTETFSRSDQPTQLAMTTLFVDKVAGTEGLDTGAFSQRKLALEELGALWQKAYNPKKSVADKIADIEAYKSQIMLQREEIKKFLTELEGALAADQTTKAFIFNSIIQALEAAKSVFSTTKHYPQWLQEVRALGATTTLAQQENVLGQAADDVEKILREFDTANIPQDTKLSDLADIWWAITLPTSLNSANPLYSTLTTQQAPGKPREIPARYIGAASLKYDDFLIRNRKAYILFTEEAAKNIREGILEATRARTPEQKVEKAHSSVREFIISAHIKGEAIPYIKDILSLYNLPVFAIEPLFRELISDPVVAEAIAQHGIQAMALARPGGTSTVGFSNKLYKYRDLLLGAFTEMKSTGSNTITDTALLNDLREAISEVNKFEPASMPAINQLSSDHKSLVTANKAYAALRDMFETTVSAPIPELPGMSREINVIAAQPIMTANLEAFPKEIEALLQAYTELQRVI